MPPAVNSAHPTLPKGPERNSLQRADRRLPFPIPILALVFLFLAVPLFADPPLRLEPETTLAFSQLAIREHKTLLDPDVDLITDTRVWSFSRIEATLFTKEPSPLLRHRGFLIYTRGPDGEVVHEKRRALEYPGIDSQGSAMKLQLLRFQATSSGNLPPAINPLLNRQR